MNQNHADRMDAMTTDAAPEAREGRVDVEGLLELMADFSLKSRRVGRMEERATDEEWKEARQGEIESANALAEAVRQLSRDLEAERRRKEAWQQGQRDERARADEAEARAEALEALVRAGINAESPHELWFTWRDAARRTLSEPTDEEVGDG